jgi:purine-binding chemotaxis protein CheW
MNLADIRKKAEEHRKSATADAIEGAVESALPLEMDSPGILILEESIFNQFEMPEAEFSVEPCSDDAQLMEQSVLLPEATMSIHEHLSAPQPFSAVIIEPEEKQCKPVSFALVPVPKMSAGYNPVETIILGRELAAGSEDRSDSQSDSYVSEAIEEYLCFRVAHEEYAISIMAIKEIVKPRDVTEVPRMPAFISGVISLRGVIIPVMDMRLRLSLPVSDATGKERIIVLRRDSGFCGVLVDEVVQVARIKKSDLEGPPAVLDGIDRDFVTGLGHFDNRMLILLNLSTILDIGIH